MKSSTTAWWATVLAAASIKSVLLIVVNLVAVTLESVPDLAQRYGPWFEATELLSLVVFTVEYGLRVWVAPDFPAYRHLNPQKARWKFITSGLGIIDLLAVLPFWFVLLVPVDLRVFLVFRVIRFLKLARYSASMNSLLEVIYAERRALFGSFVMLISATLIAASVMHLIERNARPNKFGTLPDAMWWAIVTLGTVGYGDVVPVTPLGRVLAGVTIFVGFIMIALPVGIVATAFAEQIHRRDFVVTWSMVARVPLFAEIRARGTDATRSCGITCHRPAVLQVDVCSDDVSVPSHACVPAAGLLALTRDRTGTRCAAMSFKLFDPYVKMAESAVIDKRLSRRIIDMKNTLKSFACVY